jgi:hypothetical protein
MRHPGDGTVRRLLDEPAGVSDADRRHIAGCATCRAGLAAAQEDAAAVATALAPPPDADADVDAGWRRLSQALAAESAPRAAARPRRRWRWRGPLGRPALAAIGATAVLAGGSVAAAAGWLPIFRTERVEPVEVTRADLVALPDLSDFGTVEVLEEPEVRPVADAAAAQAVTGLRVPRVRSLPRGVTGEPTYRAGGRLRVAFTFDAARSGGQVPRGLDGTRFRLSAGPGLLATWMEERGVPALVVARVVAPTAQSSGVPFSVARDHLLSLPGLAADLAAQLRAFTGDGTTLPLPLPERLVRSERTDVGGVPATVVTSRDGAVAGVVWVDDGVVTAVGGLLDRDDVLAVARAL